MATVYLLAVQCNNDQVTRVPLVNVKNRAFVSPAAREEATRNFIDDMVKHADLSHVPVFLLRDVQDAIDDMLHARKQGDLSCEVMCCRDAFGVDIEFQDVVVEREEFDGEVLN